MRPQFAMAALFFLVIGSSLLLLRARPGTLGPVAVSENGAPAPEAAAAPQAAQAAASAAPAATAAPVTVALADEAAAGDRGAVERKAKGDEIGRPSDPQAKDKEAEGGGGDARAALAAALALRQTSGCSAAVAKLDEVAVRFAGTQSAAEAMWHEATCYKELGDRNRAQQLFLALRSTGYKERAQAELDEANASANVANAQQQIGGGRAGGAARPAAPAAAPASPKRAAAKADRSYADGDEKNRGPGQAGPPAQNARPSPKAAAGFSP
jgi:hypothetical protein